MSTSTTAATYDPTDLVGPSVDAAWSEIVDPQGDEPDRLSSEAQNQIALAYQASQRLRRALEAGEVPARDVPTAKESCRRAEVLVEHLLRSLTKLVTKTANSVGKLPLKGEDLTQAANAIILAAAGSFCPDKGMAFSSWAVERMTSEFKNTCRYDAQSSLTEGEDDVARVAAGVRGEFVENHGRQPSALELQAILEGRFLSYGLEKLNDEQRLLPFDEQTKLVHKRMVRKGHRKALDNLPELLTMLQSEASLETPVGGETGTMVLGDLLPGRDSIEEVQEEIHAEEDYHRVLAAGLGGCEDREREMVLAYFELSTVDRTYRQVAQTYDVPDLVVRRLVKNVQSRLLAPHAQFNHLTDGISSQFLPEVEPQADSSIASVVRRRNRSARTNLDAAILEIVG